VLRCFAYPLCCSLVLPIFASRARSPNLGDLTPSGGRVALRTASPGICNQSRIAVGSFVLGSGRAVLGRGSQASAPSADRMECRLDRWPFTRRPHRQRGVTRDLARRPLIVDEAAVTSGWLLLRGSADRERQPEAYRRWLRPSQRMLEDGPAVDRRINRARTRMQRVVRASIASS
jgi:hypothetical protein